MQHTILNTHLSQEIHIKIKDSMTLEFSQFGEPASHCLLDSRLIRHFITLRTNPQQLPRGCAIGLPPLGEVASKNLHIFLLGLISLSLEMASREFSDETLLAVEIVPVQHPTSRIEDLDSIGALDRVFLEGKDRPIVVEGVLLYGRQGTHLGLVLFLCEQEIPLLLADLLTKQLLKGITLGCLAIFKRLQTQSVLLRLFLGQFHEAL